MTDKKGGRDSDHESFSDWTMVNEEDEEASLEETTPPDDDDEDSEEEQEDEEVDEEEEEEEVEDGSDNEVINDKPKIGTCVEEIKVDNRHSGGESSDIEMLDFSENEDDLHNYIFSNSRSSLNKFVGFQTLNFSAENIDSDSVPSDESSHKRRRRKPEAVQDEETDLSLMSSPPLPDNLPAIKPEPQYIHTPAEDLNSRLNIIVALTLACVVGLGLGHFLGIVELDIEETPGWSSRSLWEDTLNASQIIERLEVENDDLQASILILKSNNMEPIKIKGKEGKESRELRQKVNQLIADNENIRLAIAKVQYMSLPEADRGAFNAAVQENHHLRTSFAKLTHLGAKLDNLRQSVIILEHQNQELIANAAKIRYEQPMPRELKPMLKEMEGLKQAVIAETRKKKPSANLRSAKSYLMFMNEVLSAFTSFHDDDASVDDKIDSAQDFFSLVVPKGVKLPPEAQNKVTTGRSKLRSIKNSLKNKWMKLKELTQPENIASIAHETLSKMNRVIVNVVNKVKDIGHATIMQQSKKPVDVVVSSLTDRLFVLDQQFDKTWESLETEIPTLREEEETEEEEFDYEDDFFPAVIYDDDEEEIDDSEDETGDDEGIDDNDEDIDLNEELDKTFRDKVANKIKAKDELKNEKKMKVQKRDDNIKIGKKILKEDKLEARKPNIDYEALKLKEENEKKEFVLKKQMLMKEAEKKKQQRLDYETLKEERSKELADREENNNIQRLKDNAQKKLKIEQEEKKIKRLEDEARRRREREEERKKEEQLKVEEQKQRDKSRQPLKVKERKSLPFVNFDSHYFKGQYNKHDKSKDNERRYLRQNHDDDDDDDDDYEDDDDSDDDNNWSERRGVRKGGLRRYLEKPHSDRKSSFRKENGPKKQFIRRRGKKSHGDRDSRDFQKPLKNDYDDDVDSMTSSQNRQINADGKDRDEFKSTKTFQKKHYERAQKMYDKLIKNPQEPENNFKENINNNPKLLKLENIKHKLRTKKIKLQEKLEKVGEDRIILSESTNSDQQVRRQMKKLDSKEIKFRNKIDELEDKEAQIIQRSQRLQSDGRRIKRKVTENGPFNSQMNELRDSMIKMKHQNKEDRRQSHENPAISKRNNDSERRKDTSNWQSNRGEGREKKRSEERKSDWVFERSRRRKEKRHN